MAASAATSSARDMLMVSLSRFFSCRAHLTRVLPYISSSAEVSLRLIDWFVTNYARRHNVILQPPQQPGGASAHVNVHLAYRAQLKAYSKQQFDPFRRRDRIVFFYERSRSVETTVGQLNFFRWMLETGALDYVDAHAEDIERDMLQLQHAASAAKRAKGGAARQTPDRQTPDRQTPDRQTPDRQSPDRQTPDRLQPEPPRRRATPAKPAAAHTMTRIPGTCTLRFE